MNSEKAASLRKLASCRANGNLSRGPLSPEGKARSARNSLKHGLAAAAIVLAGEDPAKYERLRALYHAQLQPRTHFEAILVDNLVAAQWRQYRAICMESAAFDLETDNQRAEVDSQYDDPSPDVRAVLGLRGDLRGDRAIVACSRYSLRFERQWDRTLDQLLALLSKPPVGPPLQLLESELDPEPVAEPAPEPVPVNMQNEPNPISGHPRAIVRFTRASRVAPPSASAAAATELTGGSAGVARAPYAILQGRAAPKPAPLLP